MQPEISEAMKSNHFHFLLRKNALQTFRNNYSAKRPTLDGYTSGLPTQVC